MSVTVRWQALQDLDEKALAAWTELGLQTPRANPFAMPQFVIPAARWLTPKQPPVVAQVERGTELIGVGCFTRERPNLFVPLPHLRTYLTMHTFRADLTVQAGSETAMAEAFLDSSRKGGQRVGAIALQNVLGDSAAFAALCTEAQSISGDWFEQRRFLRPVLQLSNEKSSLHGVSKSAAADVRRRRRRLAERGDTLFRVLQGTDADPATAQTHLELEHHGWKGDQGTSMLSTPAQSGFFRELAERFGRIGGMVFAETVCSGQVVASISALRVGDTLSFFKPGWHPEFAPFSPSRLNLHSLIEQLAMHFPQVKVFDSQSREHQYLVEILPDRATVLTGVLTTTRTASCLMRAARYLRPLAYRLHRSE